MDYPGRCRLVSLKKDKGRFEAQKGRRHNTKRKGEVKTEAETGVTQLQAEES